MQLSEKYRPASWGEVIGQDKARGIVDALRRGGGLGGRAFWISGQSGTGKTTIARLIAAEVADSWNTLEIDGGALSLGLLRETVEHWRYRAMGKGRALIVNEAHRLSAPVIAALLVALEPIPSDTAVIFTTTNDAQATLFDGKLDASPFLSRCTEMQLARRNLTGPFAERLRAIAQAEGLDGLPIERYERLLKDCRNNLRRALQAVETGAMSATEKEG